MRVPRWILFCLLVTGLSVPVAGSVRAADAAVPEAGTARDVIIKADEAYNAGRYDEAVAGYRKFLDDFGSSPEAAPDIPHVRYNLSAGLIQLQKFNEAAEEAVKALKLEKPGSTQSEDLMFWRGVALLQSGNHEEAHASLKEFLEQFPRATRHQDAQLLAASSLLAGGKLEEAAEAFGLIRKIPSHPYRGRAAVLELSCLVQTGKDDAALALINEEGPAQATNINQIATFQMLALGLGDKLLEEGRQRDAIRILQNVWPLERLITLQRDKLAKTKTELALVERSPRPDIVRRSQLRQQQSEIEKELENLEKFPSFDASVRFRQASAFHQLDRFRECALLLDDMLLRMPPDAVVETASLTALQSWLAIERNDKAVEASKLFESRFPESKNLPLVLYLRGTAQQRAGLNDEAIATFDDLAKRFPDSEQAPRAFFMTGFTQLLAERNEDAAETLRLFQEKYPQHELAEPANYWRGSALAFAKKYPEAREVLGAHAAKFPKGSLLAAAAFRHAYCAQSMKDYAGAEKELKEYLEKFPEGEESAEARILLGDALLAQGKSDEGKAVYGGIATGSVRAHEDAQFKLAKILKLEEDYEGLRALLQKYLHDYPRGGRAAEALFLIGQSWRQQEQPEKAVAEYRKAIDDFGDDPQAMAVEEMFLALAKYHKGEQEQRDYLAELRALREKADKEGKPTLAVRAIWALSQAVKKSDPALSNALLREAAARVKPEETSPLILADCAGALSAAAAESAGADESSARRAKAVQLYRDLLKWHPRAAQKDKALAALAQVALEAGDKASALQYYDRLERDAPWSPLVGEALSMRAQIEREAGRDDQAIEAHTRLLAAQNVSGKLKAQSLLALGDIEMSRRKPQTAIPYYQRIYILYGKWRDTVAKAYLRSGEAFEQINDTEAARKTYEELANSEDLASLPEAQTAREKLKKFAPAPGPTPS